MEPTKTNILSDPSVGILSMNEFIGFLKISSQVNETIENSTGNNSKSNSFNFDSLGKNELVSSLTRRCKVLEGADNGSKEKEESKDEMTKKKKKRSLSRHFSLKSKIDSTDQFPRLNPCLTEKLDELLNEGILDSFLPFLCNSILPKNNANSSISPVSPGTSSITVNSSNLIKPKQILMNQKISSKSSFGERKGSIEMNSNFLTSKNARKKSISPIVLEPKGIDPELTIHVCDEVKGTSRDFCCPQKLLISKMGYFKDITSGQKLEDMDISVHCDLEIFDWLIKWVKKDNSSEEYWPKLDSANVVPILVSASFLQMEPLLNDCLSFCHSRLSEVVRTSPNLACLNDNIITRLASMFTNLELENVKDKKDRVLPRLWTKLIQSLCETEAQSIRGHYATVAGLFRCTKCTKYLTQSASQFVHCSPANMRLNRWGQILSSHTRDTAWSLTNYVSNLHKDLRSWRKVYWRLWAMCHFLYCTVCETHFPAYQMLWCLHHPEQPSFFNAAGEGKLSSVGRFPCCGQMAYRFESLTSSNGCQYREHTVVPENDRDRSILHLVNVASENSSMFEVPAIKLPTTTTSVGTINEPWWSGMSILTHRSRQGILPVFHDDAPRHTRKFLPSRQSSHFMFDSSSETESSEYNKIIETISHSASSSSDGEESAEYSPPRRQRRTHTQKRRVKIGYGRHWSGNLSARSNQDNQREFEERAMKQIVSLVGKKTGIDQNPNHQNYSQGGSYVKLEADWRETIKQKNIIAKANKLK